MFFVLSKTAALLLVPSNLLLLAGFTGLLLLLTRFRRLGRRLALTSLMLFVVLGVLPVGYTLNYILENRFPAWDSSRGAPAGFIVLGGALNPLLTLERGQPVLHDSAERLTIIPMLARDYPNARIVFSGGDASLRANQPKEADFIGTLLASFGVPPERVVLERQSRNTAENATLTKALVAPKAGERWVVVTSAVHMPRAIGAFRRAGFPVEAFPVDWHTRPRFDPQLGLSLLGGVRAVDATAHEWEGLFFYWLTGRSDAFFPAP